MKSNLKRKMQIATEILKVEPDNLLHVTALNNWRRDSTPRKFTVALTDVQKNRARK